MTQTAENIECDLAELLGYFGASHQVADFTAMEARILTTVNEQPWKLHSPLAYCSDELVAELLPAKLGEMLPLMVLFVAIHPKSFKVNSLSIFLAILRYVGGEAEGELGILLAAAMHQHPQLLADCDIIAEVLAEVEADAASDT